MISAGKGGPSKIGGRAVLPPGLSDGEVKPTADGADETPASSYSHHTRPDAAIGRPGLKDWLRNPLKAMANRSSAISFFEKAGLVAVRWKAPVVVDGRIENYAELIGASRRRNGGLLGLVRSGKIAFPSQPPRVMEEGVLPSELFAARSELAHGYREDVRSLVLLYRRVLDVAVLSLHNLTDSAVPDGDTDDISPFCRREDAGTIASLILALEMLRYEFPRVVAELSRHVDLVGLRTVHDALVRTVGRHIGLWDRVINAYVNPSDPESARVRREIDKRGEIELIVNHPIMHVQPTGQQRVDDLPDLETGFERVETHDGSALYWKVEKEEDGRFSRVRVMADLATLTEVTERLIVANGGTNDTYYSVFFPVSSGMTHIRSMGHGILNYDIELENQTRLTFSFNEAAMMHELAFGGSSPISRDPVADIWKWVLGKYLSDRTYERPFMGASSVSADVIRRTILRNAGYAGKQVYDTVKHLLEQNHGFLESIPSREVWRACSGVTVDRTGRLARVVVQIFDNHPTARDMGFDYIENLMSMSAATVLEGVVGEDGNVIRWSTKIYGPANRDLIRRVQAARSLFGLSPLTVDDSTVLMPSLPTFMSAFPGVQEMISDWTSAPKGGKGGGSDSGQVPNGSHDAGPSRSSGTGGLLSQPATDDGIVFVDESANGEAAQACADDELTGAATCAAGKVAPGTLV